MFLMGGSFSKIRNMDRYFCYFVEKEHIQCPFPGLQNLIFFGEWPKCNNSGQFKPT